MKDWCVSEAIGGEGHCVGISSIWVFPDVGHVVVEMLGFVFDVVPYHVLVFSLSARPPGEGQAFAGL